MEPFGVFTTVKYVRGLAAKLADTHIFRDQRLAKFSGESMDVDA
jgi:hypothetical protein